MPVRYRCEGGSRSFEGTLIDLSESGAYIETVDALPLLTDIRIEGEGLVLRARIVRVLWVPPEQRTPGASGGVAVRLLSVEQEPRAGRESHAQVLPFPGLEAPNA